MPSDEPVRQAALVKLRSELRAGRIAMGLNVVLLARRAGLGRTTVSNALSANADVPSADTVGTLARTLRLDSRALLQLRAEAAGLEIATVGAPVPVAVGLPVAQCDPHNLEVHPAIDSIAPNASVGIRRPREDLAMPGYVRRAHDDELADLVHAVSAGQSRMAVLVGSSSTGKTRACWEAVRPLAAAGWLLWHPYDPTRADAALTDLPRVGPRTVIWLNEAQHYLGASHGRGQRLAAGLHAVLTDTTRAPVLVLATLWPQYDAAYSEVPRAGCPDP